MVNDLDVIFHCQFIRVVAGKIFKVLSGHILRPHQPKKVVLNKMNPTVRHELKQRCGLAILCKSCEPLPK